MPDALQTGEVSLASKGVVDESQTSNAGYYVAGFSLLSAAAIAHIVIKNKDQKTSSQPLLATI